MVPFGGEGPGDRPGRKTLGATFGGERDGYFRNIHVFFPLPGIVIVGIVGIEKAHFAEKGSFPGGLADKFDRPVRRPAAHGNVLGIVPPVPPFFPEGFQKSWVVFHEPLYISVIRRIDVYGGLEAPFIYVEAVMRVTAKGLLHPAGHMELTEEGRTVTSFLKTFGEHHFVPGQDIV
jgi:hypothetical protein